MDRVQRRHDRAARLFERAVRRFRAVGAKFVRPDGKSIPVEVYRGRISFQDDSALGLRATGYVNWTCTAGQFAAIREFAGDLFGGCAFEHDGAVYRVDRLVPYVPAGLEGGYTFQTMKTVGE